MSSVEDPVTTRGIALIFVRRSGANRLGHIGYGYLMARFPHQWAWRAGSVENQSSQWNAPADKQGFWMAQPTDPLAEMMKGHQGAPPYDEYKSVFVTIPHVSTAQNTEATLFDTDYHLLGDNCTDKAYAILSAYGTQLPNPKDLPNWVPNWWYNNIPSPSFPLTDRTGLYPVL